MSVRALEEEIKNQYGKEENDEGVGSVDKFNMNMPSGNSISVAPNYINSNPLMPTNDIPIAPMAIPEMSDVPPISELVPTTSIMAPLPSVPSEPTTTVESKFINYGEIDDDDDDDEPPMQYNNPVTPVDINSIRNNAVDIGGTKEEKSLPSADLDSLLNLQNVAAGPAIGTISGSNSYLSPAEAIVKTDATSPVQQEKAADYFKTADFIPTIPSVNMGISEISAPATSYNAETAMKKLRETINELKAHGVAIQADEMNFEKSYQIIIKLDK